MLPMSMKYLLAFLMIVPFVTSSLAQVSLRKKHFNFESAGIGISGYDPVSYYTDNGPGEGEQKWSYQHDGVTYLFASQDNLNKFKLNPENYEPQYGGWCAYAMGETGEKVEVDPETYKIINGKLYLFYNFYLTNTLKKWNKDEVRLQSSANANWAAIFR